MFRVYGTLIETAAAGVFIVPVFALGNKLLFRSRRYTAYYVLFGLYLAAVCGLVGFPNLLTLRFSPNVNWIPLRYMINDLKNAGLNVLLFLPFGVMLPMLWPVFRSGKRTAWAGLAASGIIETAQLFTYRATDVDDLITNTLGAVMGYWLAKLVTKGFSRYAVRESSPRDLAAICIAVVLIMFFLQPFVSNALWELVL